MDKQLREKYLQAASTPDEPIFVTKDIMALFKFSSQGTAQRFDKGGLIAVKRNNIGHRLYSYNQIELMKKLQKLVEFDISHFTIKTLMEFEKSKGRDPNVFLDEFIEFYTKRMYSANRNAARKRKEQK